MGHKWRMDKSNPYEAILIASGVTSGAELLNSSQENIATALHLFQIGPLDDGMRARSSGTEYDCGDAFCGK